MRPVHRCARESAASTSRCRVASSLSESEAAARLFQRLQRRRRVSPQGCSASPISPSLRYLRGSDGCNALSDRAQCFERPGKAGWCRGSGRGPRSTARSRMSVACRWSLAPSRSSGCLSSASSVTGSRPATAACAASRAKIPAGVSASGSPPVSSTAIFQRINAAATRRPSDAVRRHQRCGLAVLHRFAQRDGDRPALLPRRWPPRSPSCVETAASACAANTRSLARSRQASVCIAGRIASDSSTSRPFACASESTALRAMPMRVSSACMANCGWPGAAAIFLLRITCDQPPRLFVEIGVEAGQHHGAVRQAARWSRSVRQLLESSRSSRRRSPGHRSCGKAARPPP